MAGIDMKKSKIPDRMDYNSIRLKYKKAYKLLMAWRGGIASPSPNVKTRWHDRLLYDFFDDNGIHAFVEPFKNGGWYGKILKQDEDSLYEEVCPTIMSETTGEDYTRVQCEYVTFTKCFEILDGQM